MMEFMDAVKSSKVSLSRQEVLQAMKDKYPLNSTIIITIEELSELTQALVKYLRTDGYAVHNVEEEIADVQIMIDQLRLSFNHIEIDKWDEKKIKRVVERYLTDSKNKVPCDQEQQEYKGEKL